MKPISGRKKNPNLLLQWLLAVQTFLRVILTRVNSRPGLK